MKMKEFRDDFITKVLDGVTVGEAAGTDAHKVEVPIGEITTKDVEYVLSAKAVTNGTAPGASKTITVNSYLSDEQVALADVPTVLANRKTAHTALALPDAANATRQYGVADPAKIKSKYLYITVDNTVLAVGAQVTFTLNLVRVR